MSKQPRLKLPRVKSIMDMWFDQYPIESWPWTIHPEFCEIPFQVPLTDSLVYCGTLDQIGQYKRNGKWIVADIKTTRSITPYWSSKFELDTQVTGYIYAAKQHVPEVEGMCIIAIELPEPPKDPSRKCKEHGVPAEECNLFHAKFEFLGPIERTEDQLEGWKRTAIELGTKYRRLHDIHEVKELPQEGTFSMGSGYRNLCGACECQKFCLDSRPVELFHNYFKLAPWFCMPELLPDELQEVSK